MVSIHEFGDDLKTALENLNGETLFIDSGIYRTGPLDIPSGTDILLDEGAHIIFSDDPGLYGPVFTRWEGVECWCMHPLIFINEAEDVRIRGKGIFDGSGKRWWDYIYYRRAEQKEPMTELERSFAALNPGYMDQPGGGGGRQTQFLRPPLLQIRKSRNIELEGFSLIDSPFWTLHPVQSEKLIIRDVTVRNPYVTPNTDGIDIESCRDVLIDSCTVDVGDDGIALKSGSGEDGIKAALPTENVTIKDSAVKQAHGGFVIGSETAAGVRNVEVYGCTFSGTDRGIRIKTRRGRGGRIENIYVHDTKMENVICPITLNMYYRWGSDDPELYSLESKEITPATPYIGNVRIERVEAVGCRASAGFFAGLPERPIEAVCIKDSSFEVKDEETGLEVEMFRGIEPSDFRGIRVINTDLELENVSVNSDPMISYT